MRGLRSLLTLWNQRRALHRFSWRSVGRPARLVAVSPAGGAGLNSERPSLLHGFPPLALLPLDFAPDARDSRHDKNGKDFRSREEGARSRTLGVVERARRAHWPRQGHHDHVSRLGYVREDVAAPGGVPTRASRKLRFVPMSWGESGGSCRRRRSVKSKENSRVCAVRSSPFPVVLWSPLPSLTLAPPPPRGQGVSRSPLI